MMSAQYHLERLLAELAILAEAPSRRQSDEHVAWLDQVSDEEAEQLVAVLAGHVADPNAAQDSLLGAVFRRLIANGSLFADDVDGPVLASLVTLYRQLGSGSSSRHYLLQWLATRAERTLAVFAEIIVQDPPVVATEVLVAFAPLFQRDDYDANLLFPRLLDALSNSLVASSVIDLSNFVTRQKIVPVHPAVDRRERLTHLLGDLSQGLAQLDEQLDKADEGESDTQDAVSHHARMVEDSVALAVSLCDALALIGDPAAIGKLYQALELRHRRLRTEAAAALARFDEKTGVEVLVEMATEPVMRLRVLAYAEEVGCLEEVDLQYQTAEARAEAELAVWLAMPTQFGIPPTALELVDNQQLYWPGYDEEVDCFLFRFTYRTATGDYQNIGLAGPCTHAFAADMADLAPDDIYAAFAGWQAEHDDIYELDVLHLPEASQPEVARFGRRLRDEGYEVTESLKIGSFFGERALIARARRDAVKGVAVVDQHAFQWHPAVGAHPIDADLAYCIYKGRKLLRSFNP